MQYIAYLLQYGKLPKALGASVLSMVLGVTKGDPPPVLLHAETMVVTGAVKIEEARSPGFGRVRQNFSARV